jgi:LacI family transcriptional regulator
MPRSRTKPTLHEVAAAAGVSIATASRALNGLLVSKASQERVDSAVRELGYVANETARALRSDRSHTLGLIFYALGNARGLQLLDALSSTVDAAGYSLLIATARGDESTYTRLIGRFLQRRVDGLFCVSPDGDSSGAQVCINAGIPIVALRSRGEAFKQLPLLEPAFSQAAAAATRELLALGHRRIAFIDDGSAIDPSNPIVAAWSEAPFKIERVQLSVVNGMDQLVRQLMRRSDRPSVIAASEAHAEAALAICRSSGIEVPGDVSIVAVTNAEDEARARQVGISSMLIDSHVFGDHAGALMLDWLSGKKPKNRIQIEIGRWHPRATTGPAKKSPKR